MTRRSGTSIRGEHPNRAGNKHLKNAMFMAAFAALRADPESRAYYDHKRAAGKKHNDALLCLARRRDVLYAMLRHRTTYQAKTPRAARQTHRDTPRSKWSLACPQLILTLPLTCTPLSTR